MAARLNRPGWRRYGPQALVIVVSIIAIVAIRASRDDEAEGTTADPQTTVTDGATADDTADGADGAEGASDSVELFGQEFSIAPGGSGSGTDGGTGSGSGSATASGGTSGGQGPSVSIEAVDLKAALLIGDDLPAGWTVFTGATVDPNTLAPGCAVAADALPAHFTEQLSFRFGTTGPVLTNIVTHYTTVEEATAALATLATTVGDCVTRGPNPGEPRLRSNTFAAGGGADETVAASLSFEEGDQRVSGEVLLARVGQRIVRIATITPGATAPEVGRPALATSIARQAQG